MSRSTRLAAVVALLALPAFAGTASASPHHHPGHHGHEGHPHHHGHPGHGPHHGFGPHFGPHYGFGPHHGFGPHPHPGFGPHPWHRIGPHRVFHGGHWVIVRPYPVGFGGPVFVGGPDRPVGPAAGGCATHRSASLTPYGWHRTVTVTTCIRP